jgi:hypothetical protein
MDEKVFDFQARIDHYEEQLAEKRSAFETAGKLLEDLEVRVAKVKLSYLHANPEAKKMAEEKIEMLSAVTPEQQADYFMLKGVRIRVKIAEKLMDSLDGSRGSVQSQMKWWRETNAGARSM